MFEQVYLPKSTYLIYIPVAEFLERRSKFNVKSKGEVLPVAAPTLKVKPKIIRGALSWLVACKSIKYGVTVHRQKNSLLRPHSGKGWENNSYTEIRVMHLMKLKI